MQYLALIKYPPGVGHYLMWSQIQMAQQLPYNSWEGQLEPWMKHGFIQANFMGISVVQIYLTRKCTNRL
jgi:hypothetical protein